MESWLQFSLELTNVYSHLFLLRTPSQALGDHQHTCFLPHSNCLLDASPFGSPLSAEDEASPQENWHVTLEWQFLKNFSLQEMELYSFSLEWSMQKWCYFISDVRLQKGCSFHLRYKKIFHLVHSLREFNSYIVRLLRQHGEPYVVGNWNFQLTANKELKFANEKGRGLRNGSYLHIPRQA